MQEYPYGAALLMAWVLVSARLDRRFCGLCMGVYPLCSGEMVIEALTQSSGSQHILQSEMYSRNCEVSCVRCGCPPAIVLWWTVLLVPSQTARGARGSAAGTAAVPVSPELVLITICILPQHRCCLNLLFHVSAYSGLDSWGPCTCILQFLGSALCRGHCAVLLPRPLQPTCKR